MSVILPMTKQEVPPVYAFVIPEECLNRLLASGEIYSPHLLRVIEQYNNPLRSEAQRCCYPYGLLK